MNCCVSVIILTLNEEQDLPVCLETLKWCDDVIVFDSYSTDCTEEIARAAGARFIQRKFDNYAAHRNAALEEPSFKHPWVFMVDADERVPRELAEEVTRVTTDADEKVALFRMRRKDMFLGRWIKRSCGYPTWFGRLIKVGHARFAREVHEDCYTDGEVRFLEEHIVHYPFSKGMGDWFAKHNSYSTIEAQIRLRELSEQIRWRDLLGKDPAARRKNLKQLLYHLPFRPLLVFLFLYFGRMALLEGRTGLLYCSFRAIYEYMIDLKALELRRRSAELPL